MIPRPLRAHPAAFGLLFVIAFLPLPASFADHASDTESIPWRDDYNSALEEARLGNRLLWIQFTGPWCPNCARMERESFPHPVVVQHARESFVPLKLQSDVHEQLAQNFNLSGLPATIIVGPDREVVAIHQGFLGPVDFEAFLRDCLSRMPEKTARRAASTHPGEEPPKAGDAASDPENHRRLALEGHCPVSLVRDRKLVVGQSDFTLVHDGKTYQFSSIETRDIFRADPDRYVPANNGECPVTQFEKGKAVAGDPRRGMLYKSRLFLFASESERRRFMKDPDRYAMVDVVEQGFCMHCIRQSGLLVRGDPRHQVARSGRRYWFPNATHRDAFVTSLR